MKISTLTELVGFLNKHVSATQISTALYDLLKNSGYTFTEIEEVASGLAGSVGHD